MLKITVISKVNYEKGTYVLHDYDSGDVFMCNNC